MRWVNSSLERKEGFHFSKISSSWDLAEISGKRIPIHISIAYSIVNRIDWFAQVYHCEPWGKQLLLWVQLTCPFSSEWNLGLWRVRWWGRWIGPFASSLISSGNAFWTHRALHTQSHPLPHFITTEIESELNETGKMKTGKKWMVRKSQRTFTNRDRLDADDSDRLDALMKLILGWPILIS